MSWASIARGGKNTPSGSIDMRANSDKEDTESSRAKDNYNSNSRRGLNTRPRTTGVNPRFQRQPPSRPAIPREWRQDQPPPAPLASPILATPSAHVDADFSALPEWRRGAAPASALYEPSASLVQAVVPYVSKFQPVARTQAKKATSDVPFGTWPNVDIQPNWNSVNRSFFPQTKKDEPKISWADLMEDDEEMEFTVTNAESAADAPKPSDTPGAKNFTAHRADPYQSTEASMLSEPPAEPRAVMQLSKHVHFADPLTEGAEPQEPEETNPFYLEDKVQSSRGQVHFEEPVAEPQGLVELEETDQLNFQHDTASPRLSFEARIKSEENMPGLSRSSSMSHPNWSEPSTPRLLGVLATPDSPSPLTLNPAVVLSEDVADDMLSLAEGNQSKLSDSKGSITVPEINIVPATPQAKKTSGDERVPLTVQASPPVETQSKASSSSISSSSPNEVTTTRDSDAKESSESTELVLNTTEQQEKTFNQATELFESAQTAPKTDPAVATEVKASVGPKQALTYTSAKKKDTSEPSRPRGKKLDKYQLKKQKQRENAAKKP